MNKLLKTTLVFGGIVMMTSPLAFAQTPATTLCGSDNNPLCSIPASVTNIPKLISLLLSIAIAVAVIWTLFNLIKAGIQYTGSGADASKKKEALGSVISAVVGLVIVLVSFVVVQTIGGFFNLNVNTVAQRLDLGPCTVDLGSAKKTGIKTHSESCADKSQNCVETSDPSKTALCRVGDGNTTTYYTNFQ